MFKHKTMRMIEVWGATNSPPPPSYVSLSKSLLVKVKKKNVGSSVAK